MAERRTRKTSINSYSFEKRVIKTKCQRNMQGGHNIRNRTRIGKDNGLIVNRFLTLCSPQPLIANVAARRQTIRLFSDISIKALQEKKTHHKRLASHVV